MLGIAGSGLCIRDERPPVMAVGVLGCFEVVPLARRCQQQVERVVLRGLIARDLHGLWRELHLVENRAQTVDFLKAEDIRVRKIGHGRRIAGEEAPVAGRRLDRVDHDLAEVAARLERNAPVGSGLEAAGACHVDLAELVVATREPVREIGAADLAQIVHGPLLGHAPAGVGDFAVLVKRHVLRRGVQRLAGAGRLFVAHDRFAGQHTEQIDRHRVTHRLREVGDLDDRHVGRGLHGAHRALAIAAACFGTGPVSFLRKVERRMDSTNTPTP